jgi:hypothetical protein
MKPTPSPTVTSTPTLTETTTSTSKTPTITEEMSEDELAVRKFLKEGEIDRAKDYARELASKLKDES